MVLLVLGGVISCAAADGSRWDVDTRSQQDAVLDDLARAVPLLHRAGHDVTVDEFTDYLRDPSHTSERGRGDGGETSVLSSTQETGTSTLIVATYEWYRDPHDRIHWGRACASVTVDEQDSGLSSADIACPASAPKVPDTLPTPGSPGDWSSRTPLELAVTEARRGDNADELRQVLEHPELAGVAYGG